MSRVTWEKDEVIAYLEDKIIGGLASHKEEEMYSTYIWDNKIKYINTYNKIIEEMDGIYNGKL